MLVHDINNRQIQTTNPTEPFRRIYMATFRLYRFLVQPDFSTRAFRSALFTSAPMFLAAVRYSVLCVDSFLCVLWRHLKIYKSEWFFDLSIMALLKAILTYVLYDGRTNLWPGKKERYWIGSMFSRPFIQSLSRCLIQKQSDLLWFFDIYFIPLALDCVRV